MPHPGSSRTAGDEKTHAGCTRKHLKSEQAERLYHLRQRLVNGSVVGLEDLLPPIQIRTLDRETSLICVHQAQELRCKRCT